MMNIEQERKDFEGAKEAHYKKHPELMPQTDEESDWCYGGWLMARNAALTQPQQEPVAWVTEYECPATTTVRLLADMSDRQREYVERHAKAITLLFTAPPAPSVELTEEDILQTAESFDFSYQPGVTHGDVQIIRFARKIIAQSRGEMSDKWKNPMSESEWSTGAIRNGFLSPMDTPSPSADLTDAQIEDVVKKFFGVFSHKPKKGRVQEPAILAGNMSHAIALCRDIIAKSRGQS